MKLSKIFAMALLLVGIKAMALTQQQLTECFIANKNNPRACLSNGSTQADFDVAWKKAVDSGKVASEKKPDFAGFFTDLADKKVAHDAALDKAWQDAGHPGEKAPDNFVKGKSKAEVDAMVAKFNEDRKTATAGDKAVAAPSAVVSISGSKTYVPSPEARDAHNDAENAYYKVNGFYPEDTDRKVGNVAKGSTASIFGALKKYEPSAEDKASHNEVENAYYKVNGKYPVVKHSAGDKVILDKVAADLRIRCDKFESELSLQQEKVQTACGDGNKLSASACFDKIREEAVNSKSAAEKAIDDHRKTLESNTTAALKLNSSIFGKLSEDDSKRIAKNENSSLAQDHLRIFKLLHKLQNLSSDNDLKKMQNACGHDDKCRVDRYNEQIKSLKDQILIERDHSRASKREYPLSKEQLKKLFGDDYDSKDKKVANNGFILDFKEVRKSAKESAENLDTFVANLKEWKWTSDGQPTSKSHTSTQEKCCKEHSSFWCDGDGRKVMDAALGKKVTQPAPVAPKEIGPPKGAAK